MPYFKNVELARRYNIGESTVRNWIRLTKDGKLKLTIIEVGGHQYVANTPRNILIIKKLVQNNKKYRNSLSLKITTPSTRFYSTFTAEQVYDIVRNLELNHEIPRQYNYFDRGAEEWDQYIRQIALNELPSGLINTQLLLTANQEYVDRHLNAYETVNIIDIGVGNAMPTKDLISRLRDKGQLGKYVALDISPSMLKVAERNVHEWFGKDVAFEGHLVDITHQRFSQIVNNHFFNKGVNSMNLLLFLGAIPTNFRYPFDTFRVINESMGPEDLLICTERLEKDHMRPEWFNFEYDVTPKKFSLAQRHRLVLELLNIKDTFYEAETGFNSQIKQRYSRIRLKTALSIQFNYKGESRAINFEKGDTILLWRSWQMTVADIFKRLDRTGFSVLQSSQTEDQEYILTISKVKRN